MIQMGFYVQIIIVAIVHGMKLIMRKSMLVVSVPGDLKDLLYLLGTAIERFLRSSLWQ